MDGTKPAAKTHVTFQSELFNHTEQRDYFINPDCFGDDFCKFIMARLEGSDVQCGRICGEDWGWGLELRFQDREYEFCTNYHVDGFWLGIIKPVNGLWALLRGRKITAVPIELVKRIHSVLFNNPGISEIRWHEAQQFDKGNYEQGSPEPA